MKEIQVLHVISDYLPKTQQWLNLLISNSKTRALYFTKRLIATYKNITVKEYRHGGLYQFDTSQTKPIIKKIYAKLILQKVWPFSKDLDIQFSNTNIDIVHAHFSNVGCDIMKSKKVKSIPFLVSFYGWDYEMLPFTKPIYLEKYKSLFQEADKIIVEGPHGKKILSSYNCPEDKIAIVPLGIKLFQSSLKFKTKTSETKLKLVQLASFREKKGQLFSIQAVHLALDNNLDVSIEFAGNIDEQAYYQEVQNYIQKHNLGSYVTFKEFVPYEQINEYLHNFDIFIQPSCYAKNRDCEGGAPTTLFNAMNAGVPIIATDHCDIPFVVEDKKTGVIAKEKNTKDLYEAIKYFYFLSAEEYQNYSRNCIHEVKNRFDITKNAQVLDSIYSELAKNNEDPSL